MGLNIKVTKSGRVSAGKGFMPFPALIRSDFATFLLRSNAALNYQTFHAEPQSLSSRRDDTYERLSSLRGHRPCEERAERPSVYVESMRRYIEYVET